METTEEAQGGEGTDTVAPCEGWAEGLCAWAFVESSNIHAICYEALTGTLFVRFWRKKADPREPDQAVYRYEGVPAMTYNRLREAPSIGAFFAAEVKKAFSWTRLELLP